MADSKTLRDEIERIRRDGGKTNNYAGMDETISLFYQSSPSLAEVASVLYEQAMRAKQESTILTGEARHKKLEEAALFAWCSVGQAQLGDDVIGAGYGAVLSAEILPGLGRAAEAVITLRQALTESLAFATQVADVDKGRYDNLMMNLYLWLLYLTTQEGSTTASEVLEWLSAVGGNAVFNRKISADPTLFGRELAAAALYLARHT